MPNQTTIDCFGTTDTGKIREVNEDQFLIAELSKSLLVHQTHSSVLWNALGGGSTEVAPEVYKMKSKPRDTMLLCTDGLTKHVADEELRRLFHQRQIAERSVRHLSVPPTMPVEQTTSARSSHGSALADLRCQVRRHIAVDDDRARCAIPEANGP